MKKDVTESAAFDKTLSTSERATLNRNGSYIGRKGSKNEKQNS